jgi:hypothetical protein
MTREEWLQTATSQLRPMFQDAGKPLPDHVHISIGFASKRKRIGECWSQSASADARHHIFLSPIHANDLALLETLVHELCHAALPPKTGHRKPFQRLASAVGLTAPWTSTGSTPELVERLNALIQSIGPSPHATLRADQLPKKQSTRLRLFECGCGVKVRVARNEFHATCDDCGESFSRKDSDNG